MAHGMIRLACGSAAVIGAIICSGFAAFAQSSSDADTSALVAEQIRQQGFSCDNPTSVKRDPDADDDAVWMLTCANASYRVRLVPDQAAEVETLH